MHPGLAGTSVDDGRPTLGVVGGGDHARRLVEQVVHEPGRTPRWARRRGRPRRLGVDPAAEDATSPSTVTRPASMRILAVPSAAEPCRASTFWSRSPCGPDGSTRHGLAPGPSGSSSRSSSRDGRRVRQPGCLGGGRPRPARPRSTRRPCSSASTTSAPGMKCANGGRSSSESRPSRSRNSRGGAEQQRLARARGRGRPRRCSRVGSRSARRRRRSRRGWRRSVPGRSVACRPRWPASRARPPTSGRSARGATNRSTYGAWSGWLW